MAMRIKVCGITRCEDAELAVSLGAGFIGLNFYPPSPRCLTIERAAAIARAVKGRALLVGVFVNSDRAYVKERLESLDLDLLQFHGDEDDAALEGWPVAVIRALRLRSDAVLDAIQIDRIKADYVLIDTLQPRLFGGTGQARRLDTLRVLDLSRVFVSGGLRPDNVAAAAAFEPYALDVASGVESAPGIKDPDKLRSFIVNANKSLRTSERPLRASAGPSHANAKPSR